MAERLCSFFLLFWSVVCLWLYKLVKVVKLVDAPHYMLKIDLTHTNWSFLASVLTQVLIWPLSDFVVKTRSTNFSWAWNEIKQWIYITNFTQGYNRSISTFGQFMFTLKLASFYSFLNLSDLTQGKMQSGQLMIGCSSWNQGQRSWTLMTRSLRHYRLYKSCVVFCHTKWHSHRWPCTYSTLLEVVQAGFLLLEKLGEAFFMVLADC